MRFLLPIAALCLALAQTPAGAQDLQRIAAVVNDDVISGQDVERRMSLVLSSTGTRDSPEARRRVRDQVLRALIDERVQLQEAARLNISVSDEELDRGFRAIEQQNNVPPGQIDQFLARQGVDKAALAQQLRAEISWSKVIRRRLLPTVDISDEEIESTLARLQASRGVTELLVSEIFLSVDNPDQEEEIRRTAQRMVEEIRRGASFTAIARQFSQNASAATGGDIGWVQPGNLPDDVESVLATMPANQISEPIRSSSGYYIVLLRERRQIAGGNPADTRIGLKQILLPVPAGAPPGAVESQLGQARSIAGRVQGCQSFDRAIQEQPSKGSGDLGTVRIGDLPAQFRPIVTQLPIGKPSEPVRTENGVHVLMVCERSEAEGGLPSREDIRQGLVNRRIGLLARRYLRDLRRDAVVELR